MISGRKCRHLNRAGVDIGGREGKFEPAYFTINWFLRHNRGSCIHYTPLPLLQNSGLKFQNTIAMLPELTLGNVFLFPHCFNKG